MSSMNGALIAGPSQNAAPDATVAWVGATEDPLYPVENVQTLEPDTPAKTTAGGTVILRATLPAAEELAGVALINTNLSTLDVELTNNAAMPGQTRTVITPEDGLCVNVWWDLRTVTTGRTASEWSVTINDAVRPVAVGTLLLIRQWTHLRVRWEWELRERFPMIEHRTGYGKRLQYQIPVRVRKYRALPFKMEDRAAVRAVRREAHGSILPWVLVPDWTDDDVLLVQHLDPEHSETYRFGYNRFPDHTATGIVDMPMEVEEVNAGILL